MTPPNPQQPACPGVPAPVPTACLSVARLAPGGPSCLAIPWEGAPSITLFTHWTHLPHSTWPLAPATDRPSRSQLERFLLQTWSRRPCSLSRPPLEATPLLRADEYAFMGALIIQEVVRELLGKGLSGAKVLLLAGSR